MDDNTMLEDIINCFTSIDQLLTFANTYGLIDDTYVISRLEHLRRGANSFHLTCSICHKAFSTHVNYELHKLEHDIIEEFNLSLFDDAPSSVNYMDTTPEKLNFSKTRRRTLNEKIINNESSTNKKMRLSSQTEARPSFQYGAGIDNEPAYTFSQIKERTYAKTGAIDKTFQAKFTSQLHNKKLSEITDDLHGLFDDILNKVRQDSDDNSLARVIIEHNGLTDPIVVSLRELNKMDSSVVMDEIIKVLQSNEELPVDDSCTITVGRIDIPSGGGRLRITKLSGEHNSLMRKRSIVNIPSTTLCMPMAIAVCFLKSCEIVSPTNWRLLTKGDSSSMPDKVLKHKCYPHWYYKHVVEKGRKECTVFARRLCELVGVSTEKMCNINEIQLFERLLNLQILVISSKLWNKFIRIGENEPIRKKVFLYLVEQDEFQHFTAIVSLTGFFTCNYFCSTCLKPYNDKDQHSCETTCTVCCSSCCIHTSSTMSCRTCNRLCRSQECFLKHAEKKQTRKGGSLPSECEKRYQCKICKKLLDWDDRPPTVHQCGEWKCPCCKEYYTGEHLCYQRKIVNELNDNIMIFFDTETKQDSLLQCKNGYNPTDTTCEKCTNQDKKCGKCKLCQTCNKSWCGSREHTVNFICMQTVCNHCQEKPILQTTKCFYCGVRCSLCSQREKNAFKGGPCVNTCGFRMRLFKDSKATDEFCRTVFSDQYKNSILLSHNGSGYDNYFLLEWLLTNSIRPEIIFSGSKIMYMLVRRGLNIKVLDSLNFLPMKLSKIPKAFGLKELKKGYFPHFFNTEDNQAYVGPYPHARYYGADYMNTSDRENFLIWYETRKNKVFNFAQEMEEYCVSDTSILREGLIKFRNLMLQVTGTEMETTDSETGEPKITYPGGVDPLDYVTIASVCMGIYKSKFLTEDYDIQVTTLTSDHVEWKRMQPTENGFNVRHDDAWLSSEAYLSGHSHHRFGRRKFVRSPLAHVPSEGYTKRYNHSKISIAWLEWIMDQNKIHIQHALNGGEFKIQGTNYHSDGYCQKTNTVYEFLGCCFHGCRVCYPNNRAETKHPLTKQSMEELYVVTKKRESAIRDLGYKYRQIWEHEFKRDIDKTDDLKAFIDRLGLMERISPRDAFMGGRCNGTKMYCKTDEGEKIKYVDFTSLYPWTNKYSRYPLGHPKIITSDFEDIHHYFGLCKLKILPPRGLYHPVLPYRCNKKLTFPLCRTCVEEENRNPCICSEEKRAFVGTYATPEVLLAVEKGYKILKIYEIWHFPETTKYDKEMKSGGLFSDYVQLFLKIKQESSGFPKECKTEEQKQEYIRLYKENEVYTLTMITSKKTPVYEV